jgi:hypothetical protein
MRIVRNNDQSGNNLDRHFRELRNLETPPSSDLWDKVEYRLDDDRERIKQTPSLPDAAPRSHRPRCGGRESKFLAAGA